MLNFFMSWLFHVRREHLLITERYNSGRLSSYITIFIASSPKASSSAIALRGATLSVLPIPPQGKPVHQHKEPPASPPVSPTLEPDSSAESPSPRALSDSPPEIAAATPPPKWPQNCQRAATPHERWAPVRPVSNQIDTAINQFLLSEF